MENSLIRKGMVDLNGKVWVQTIIANSIIKLYARVVLPFQQKLLGWDVIFSSEGYWRYSRLFFENWIDLSVLWPSSICLFCQASHKELNSVRVGTTYRS